MASISLNRACNSEIDPVCVTRKSGIGSARPGGAAGFSLGDLGGALGLGALAPLLVDPVPLIAFDFFDVFFFDTFVAAPGAGDLRIFFTAVLTLRGRQANEIHKHERE